MTITLMYKNGDTVENHLMKGPNDSLTVKHASSKLCAAFSRCQTTGAAQYWWFLFVVFLWKMGWSPALWNCATSVKTIPGFYSSCRIVRSQNGYHYQL